MAIKTKNTFISLFISNEKQMELKGIQLKDEPLLLSSVLCPSLDKEEKERINKRRKRGAWGPHNE